MNSVSFHCDIYCHNIVPFIAWKHNNIIHCLMPSMLYVVFIHYSRTAHLRAASLQGVLFMSTIFQQLEVTLTIILLSKVCGN